MSGTIIKVSGPLAVAEGMADAKMADAVRVGKAGLQGEIVHMIGDQATIQVFEGTNGLMPGEPVISTGVPRSVELGPGLLGTIYDGIQRPLEAISAQAGDIIPQGINLPALDRAQKWAFHPGVTVGDRVVPGDIIGTTQETDTILHKIMVPVGISGTVQEIHSGARTVEEIVAVVRDLYGKTHPLTMLQRWSVGTGRPYQRRLIPSAPLLLAQQGFDAMPSLVKGGTAAISGLLESNKRMVLLQTLVQNSDVDVVIYIACGTRGSQVADLIGALEPLRKRTVLVASTADLPTAAQEASICTGITIGEYYRDMGYDVAVIADSSSRLTPFYGRAGMITCLGSDGRQGSLSAIGAICRSDRGGVEPVYGANRRLVKAFWSLSREEIDGEGEA